mmetsp:Transcript_103695/g.332301  ORF Transcript_103695/g.332301 Transcript_103695/m.332301 type:complete len:211 (+) Transcript_103695:1099-1731(+)
MYSLPRRCQAEEEGRALVVVLQWLNVLARNVFLRDVGSGKPGFVQHPHLVRPLLGHHALCNRDLLPQRPCFYPPCQAGQLCIFHRQCIWLQRAERLRGNGGALGDLHLHKWRKTHRPRHCRNLRGACMDDRHARDIRVLRVGPAVLYSHKDRRCHHGTPRCGVLHLDERRVLRLVASVVEDVVACQEMKECIVDQFSCTRCSLVSQAAWS